MSASPGISVPSDGHRLKIEMGQDTWPTGWKEASVVRNRDFPLAWVESPLQLVSAAELAASRGIRIRVIFRLGPQMPETAAALLERGADFEECVPYLGIPWKELRRAREWIIGDGLSGQFRLAAAVLRPRTITLLDDGTMSLALAAGIAGTAPFERLGHTSSTGRNLLGDLTRDHLLRLAGTDSLEFASVYGVERPEFAAIAALGVRLRANRFDWTRRTARPPQLPSARVLLGSARVVDGLLNRDDYLAEVARFVVAGPVVYLPHRREAAADVAAVRAIAGITVIEPGIPVELFLAGLDGVELLSFGSSADATLARVLAPAGTSAAETAP